MRIFPLLKRRERGEEQEEGAKCVGASISLRILPLLKHRERQEVQEEWRKMRWCITRFAGISAP